MTRLSSALTAAGLAILGFLPASGQESVVLKDGSILYGHIVKDNFDNQTISFDIDSALMVVATKDVQYDSPELRLVSGLPEAWKRWFNNHRDKIVMRNGKEYGWIGSVEPYSYVGNKTFYKGLARIEEVTDSTIKFFTPNIGNITLNKKEGINYIVHNPRHPRALVGVIDEVKTTDGKIYHGQIIEERAREIILLSDDGVRNVIPVKMIKMRKVNPYNSNRPLRDQMPYITRIELAEKNSGSMSPMCIITEIVSNSSPKQKDGYYLATDCDGYNSREYKFSDVASLSYVKNANYVEDLDVEVNDDQLLVNGKEVLPVKYVEMADRYEIPDTANAIKVKAADLEKNLLKLHFKDQEIKSDFIFVEAIPDNTVATNNKSNNKNASSKKKKDAENTEEGTPFYSLLRDIIDSKFIPIDRFVSPAGNVSLKYGPVSAGKAYLLIRKSGQNKSGYLIIVE